jgi:hypothetical protein
VHTRNERPGRAQRTALAIVVSAVAMVCFWAFGGVSSAKSSSAAWQYQYGGLVTMCRHKTYRGDVTVQVHPSTVPDHLRQGDTLGPCTA